VVDADWHIVQSIRIARGLQGSLRLLAARCENEDDRAAVQRVLAWTDTVGALDDRP
jgi:hypothetical protein